MKFWLLCHGRPEWRPVTGMQLNTPAVGSSEREGGVRIYIPDNGRGYPPGREPPMVTIEADE